MKVKLVIPFNVPVDTYEDALKYIKELLKEYAESNDGSEFLVNLNVNENTLQVYEKES